MSFLSGEELDAFRRGDEAVFRRLVEEVSSRMLALVRPYARDLDEAHDLVQESWHQAYVQRGSFRGDGSIVGWLLTIARNRARMSVRGHPKRQQVECLDTLADPVDASAEIVRGEQRDALLGAVAALPERERDTVLLRLLHGLSTRETAERLGCAEGTVKAALHHALEKLKPRLKEWVR